MKMRSFVFLFLAVFAGSFFLASCLNEDNKIPDNCYDGVLNNGEINIDCGGPNCEECDHCTNGVWEPERGEVWLDCGGECPVCPTCANGVQDGDETEVDCGGSCGGCELLCGDGLLNGAEVQIDCDTIVGVCENCPNCEDGLFNGTEAGIDCGGTETGCPSCCSTGNCGNGIQDGMEFYVDCGGGSCPACDTLFSFKIGSTVYTTPRSVFNEPTYDEVTGTLTFSMEPAFDTDEDAPPLPMGTLTITVTAPPLGWAGSLGAPLEYPIPFMDATLYAIEWTDDLGFTYRSALLGGECAFTMVKYKDLTIVDSDNCQRDDGDYRFFRGVFEGTLIAVDPAAPSPTVSLSQGLFQFTFFAP
jgi:hypothetical protein